MNEGYFTWPSAAFIALFVVALVIGGALYARRHDQLRSRGAGKAIAVIVGLLVIFGLGGGFLLGIL